MKQHIAIEEIPNGESLLNEKLLSWLFANDEDFYFELAEIAQRNYNNYKAEGILREMEFNIAFSNYFTIGKMIEIISLKEPSYSLVHNEGYYCLTLDRGMGGIEIETNVLCDTIFTALKIVLEDTEKKEGN